jgi:ketosteroid isomerase-like protein
MSQENVDVVRASFEACNRHDEDLAVSAYHPDIEYRFAASVDEPLICRGREAVKDAYRQIWADWEETFSDPVQLFDLGDKVLVEFIDRRIGRDGIKLEDRASEVWTLEDRLVVRIEAFDSWSEALEAAGLSE